MSKRNPRILKIFLYMLLLNSLFLCIYFAFHSSSSSPEPPPPHLPSRFHVSVNNQSAAAIQKPWPILPSYLPWTPPQNNLPPRSCEGYFGNGFTKRIDFLRPTISKGREGGSWFRCHYSETLRSSICEGRNLRMDPDRIAMSKGGEKLEEVMGRGEEVELPEFRDGAFEVVAAEDKRRIRRIGGVSRRLVSEEMLDEYIQEGGIDRHTMRGLVGSIRVVATDDFVCDEWVEEPTLLVTRFEYANMFHTVTDWYSAYVSARVTGLPNRPHVVFIDGHCTTQLEETWTALFSGIRYAKNFTKPVCFRHAILSPLGYETALFKGLSGEIECNGESARSLWLNPDNKKTARLSEFGEMIRSSFGFPVNRHRSTEKPLSSSSSSSPVHNVLFVRREDYLAHPRHGGKVQSRLVNEEEVFESLHQWVASGSTGLAKCGINLVNGLFAHMSMRDQVKAIQDASVIIGAHGAGLTHIVSATPNTTIFEIISVEFRRPHFELIAKWKGLEYHPMHLANSRADPTAVIEKLKEIMKSLGC